MKTIKHKSKEINIPSNWRDINIDKFQQIDKLKINEAVDLDIEEQNEKSVALISILTGLEKEDIVNLPYRVFKKIEESILFIYQQKQKKIKPIIEIKGVKYGYRKNLNDMKTKEYFDFDKFSSSENLIQDVHILMAIIYRPIISQEDDTYEIEEYSGNSVIKRAEIFKYEMTVEDMLSATVFLTAHVKILSEHMQDYLRNQKK